MKKFTDITKKNEELELEAELSNKTYNNYFQQEENKFFSYWDENLQNSIHILVYLESEQCILLSKNKNEVWGDSEYIKVPSIICPKNSNLQQSSLTLLKNLGLNPQPVQNIELVGPLYIDPNSNRKIWYTILKTNESLLEVKRGLTKISIDDIHNLKKADLITSYLISLLIEWKKNNTDFSWF